MSLRGDVLHSIKWLAGARLAGQIVAWAVTIVVIRILDPSDYGLMALAEIMIGFAALFRQMGLYEAIIQNRDITARQIEQSFGILLSINSAIYVLLFFSAPWIATFFDEPRLVAITRVMGIQFPLAALGVVQSALLSRRMDFKRKSFVNLSATLTNSTVTLAFALSGAGVWALVYGGLAAAVVRPLGFILAAQHWCWPRFSREGMASMARFGGFITASRIMWYFYSRADVFIIGKFLGKDLLGFYTVAMELASLPQRKTAAILGQVGLAAYSSVQHDMDVVRSHYLKVIRLLAFVSFPIFWGMSCVAPEFVNVVLGQRWSMAIIPLQIITTVMPLRMLANGSGSPVTAIGKPHLGTIGQVFALLIMPPSFLIGTWYGGLMGASLAWVTSYPVLALIRLKISLPALGLRYADYFRCLAGPAAGGAVMYGTVIVVKNTLTQPLLSPSMELAALIITGALAYILFMWLLCRRRCLEFTDLAAKS